MKGATKTYLLFRVRWVTTLSRKLFLYHTNKLALRREIERKKRSEERDGEREGRKADTGWAQSEKNSLYFVGGIT